VKRIGVFTSGGDSPGMNACIRAVVRNAIYHDVEVFGIYRGYKGMIDGDIHQLKSDSVSNILQRGGTILKSSRSPEFMEFEGRKKAFENLQKFGIEGLIAIGGNGTFAGAHQFEKDFGIPTIGAPGTIDNDLYGTDFTIGFDTAVNTAIDAIDKIRDTADSHDRVFFVEVMGRDAGYIAVQCGLSCGAEMVLIPERTDDTIEDVLDALKEGKRRKKNFSIIVIAEGDQLKAVDVMTRVNEEIPEVKARLTTLGHIQRGGSPTAFDRILASRLGFAAVEALLDGKKNLAVGLVNDHVSFTPFEDAFKKPKPIHKDLMRMMKVLSR